MNGPFATNCGANSVLLAESVRRSACRMNKHPIPAFRRATSRSCPTCRSRRRLHGESDRPDGPANAYRPAPVVSQRPSRGPVRAPGERRHPPARRCLRTRPALGRTESNEAGATAVIDGGHAVQQVPSGGRARSDATGRSSRRLRRTTRPQWGRRRPLGPSRLAQRCRRHLQS